MGAFFYRLGRHKISDVSLTRWVQVILLALAIIAGLNWQSGGWILSGLLLLGMITFTFYKHQWQRRSYVTFEESDMPAVAPHPLKPADKIPIYASGHFSVEAKQGHFTWLNGYFRTFATREHALLCLVQPSRFALLGKSPEKDVGMWYIFFKADEIESIRWGRLTHGADSLPGLAITLRVFIPKQRRFQRDRTLRRVVYMACPSQEEASQILADLLYEEKARLGKVPHQNGTGKLPHNSDAWRRIQG